MKLNNVKKMINKNIFLLLILIILTTSCNIKENIKTCSPNNKEKLCYTIGKNYVYIKILQFTKNTHIYFNKIPIENKKNIIFDLRNNGGGNLGATREILSYLIKEKPLFIINSNKKDYLFYSIKAKYKKNNIKNTYTIINKKTASAAEVFTISIAANFNNITIGEKSFGKTTIQKEVNGERKTVAIYKPINQVDISKGIVPDIKSIRPINYINNNLSSY